MAEANDSFGVYVHVPFCRRKCAYCDFYSQACPDRIDDMGYVEAVLAEWNLRRDEVPGSLATLYVGGGTPSLLSVDAVHRLVRGIISDENPVEITIECNPDDVNPDMVSGWLHSGINRVSMGIQSFDDACLREISRRHDSAGAMRAYKILRDCGVRNISLDLIYGLPRQDMTAWRTDLDRLIDLAPEHFSAYILGYEPGTPLFRRLQSGDVREADDELIERMYAYLCEASRSAGYEHYEISNFALPACRAVHNANYWRDHAYIGLGPAAYSFDGLRRRSNPRNLKGYMNSLQAGVTAFEIEVETASERTNDIIMTALRTAEGLDLDRLPLSHQRMIMESVHKIPDNLINVAHGRIIIPENQWLMSDAVIRTLMVE